MKYKKVLLVAFVVIAANAFAADYRGQLSANPYAPNSVSNPYGQYGNPYSPNSLNNLYGAGNPYNGRVQKLQDSEGRFRGNLNTNQYDPDSVNNPYGRYGSKYSPDSVNNPYGAGNPYNQDSPSNPYGKGLSIYEE